MRQTVSRSRHEGTPSGRVLGTTEEISGLPGAPGRVVHLHMLTLSVWTTHQDGSSGIPRACGTCQACPALPRAQSH